MSHPKDKNFSQLKSFAAAFTGIKTVFANERNFRTHLCIAILAVVACFFFKVTTTEWLIVLLFIAIILCMETINTSIEYVCDYVSPEYQPLIKKVKDVAAGAVMLGAIISVIAGCIIFIPYLLELI